MKPPRPTSESEPPKYPAEDREIWLRELKRLEERVNRRIDALEAVAEAGSETAESLRELISDHRDLSTELRELIGRERDRERAFWQLHSQVQILATRSGELAGLISGRDAGDSAGRSAARDEAKHNGAKWTVIVMILSAATTGIIQGVRAAFEKPPVLQHQTP